MQKRVDVAIIPPHWFEEFHIIQLREQLKKLFRQLLITGSGIHVFAVDSIVKVITNGTTPTPGNTIVFCQTEVMEHIDVISQGVARILTPGDSVQLVIRQRLGCNLIIPNRKNRAANLANLARVSIRRQQNLVALNNTAFTGGSHCFFTNRLYAKQPGALKNPHAKLIDEHVFQTPTQTAGVNNTVLPGTVPQASSDLW